MSASLEKPYGSWESPITADLTASATVSLGQIALNGKIIYWTETRPHEGGRCVIVCQTEDGKIKDINPAPYSAKSRVHEYGGGAFLATADSVFFSNFEDQRIYRQKLEADPKPITPEGNYRYADAVFDQQRNRLICVREDHSQKGAEAINTLVAISLEDQGSISVLASGADFYASPRLSPDGNALAWLSWNHPNMPWDGTELWLAQVDKAGNLAQEQSVAGSREESIFQPEWSPGGVLYFISDRNGWWNLYRWYQGSVAAVIQMEAEFGLPQWIFGQSTYAFTAADRIICTYSSHGISHLAVIDPASCSLKEIKTPYIAMSALRANSEQVVFIAASPTEFSAIVQLDLATEGLKVLQRSSEMTLDPGYLSIAQALEFPVADGVSAYGFFYPPKNKDFSAPAEDERPPLLVISHGGPTGAAHNALELKIQYWTSRGIAVLDVNYRGSSHYGRAYRQQLKGQWGIVDVDDCISGALYLVQQGGADPKRLAIRGSSAGGFTTLAALTFRGVFKAGASYYGVSDLEALAKETHKFESRYLDWLIGPYPAQADLYIARSPIHAVDKLSCPTIFFQGLEDKVVPPDQAKAMVNALRKKKLPVACIFFEDEQHGFCKAENISRALTAELYFYAQVFGFSLADEVEPIVIENL
ncbi:peptidase S9 prolyl oligopeptidase active site domain-containing protein [Candidatus Nitrosoglobus terrae]|uniref:Peptidase S9 prolyl oligopeptidase active site domain-containing protein n=1 Tax=Candidatus Nitrosoglobus terrae TaxID=1630141 RepID=A0A1Q2SM95_9GAMM|nr:prolyl oligopeptidase family serine peptidase [Candidatus Nitrosoglobus terrae]BAW80219.1 peptidase S9 prolyl oligopeptidase active site domain-containing protein [Candidatus Nitrosoglobus terrae]